MKKNLKDKKSLNIAMLGHKRIPSREGGIEIVVEELATRMVTLGHKVTCYNRSGHHVSGKDFDGGKRKAYKGVRLKSVLTLDKKGLAAMTASVSGAICAAFGKYDVVHFHPKFESALSQGRPIIFLCGAGLSVSLGDHAKGWIGWLKEGKAYLSDVEAEELDRRFGSYSASELIDAASFLIEALRKNGNYTAYMDSTIGSLRVQNKKLANRRGVGCIFCRCS